MREKVTDLLVKHTDRFVIDVSSQQDFCDGVNFGEQNITPLIKEFLADKRQIIILIPEGTPFYKPEQQNTTVMAEFFVGALEKYLRKT